MVLDYNRWLAQVRAALQSINMPLEQWQQTWEYGFRAEYEAGTAPAEAAAKANRYWWREQNTALNQECRATPNCWLPRGHQGNCQPM